MKSQVLHHRQFKHLDECFLCKGVLFCYKDTSINLDMLSAEDREKMRRMVSDGMQLSDLMESFPDGFCVEEWNTSVCEKCGDECSYPVRGGA